MKMSESPIFLRGLSRSGGTLLVTMLDAHPDVAMSYELYPNLLDPLMSDDSSLEYFLNVIEGNTSIKKEVSGDLKKIRTFITRCFRGGLDTNDLSVVYQDLSKTRNRLFEDPDDAYLFIGACAARKMKKEGKVRWGMKCNNSFERYLSMWPDANFINVVRDGRDVLSSQLVTGSFSRDVKGIAKGYVNAHKKFQKLLDTKSVSAMNVFYETLVSDSESSVRTICEFLNIPVSNQMLRYFDKDLTIYKNSMGHLSLDRISQPIDASKIGRWKNELSQSDLEQFYLVAEDTLKDFNYL